MFSRPGVLQCLERDDARKALDELDVTMYQVGLS